MLKWAAKLHLFSIVRGAADPPWREGWFVLANERIRPPFGSDFCRRPVTWQHGHVVAERKYSFSDAFEQKIGISTR
jgi:hypothetical protein